MASITNPHHKVSIRKATIQDVSIILTFIHELAEFERMSADVIATKDLLVESLFVHKGAEVIILEENDIAIGFALFFPTYSTFLGQQNLHLEDLYISKDKRHMGYGKKMLQYLAQIAIDRKMKRLEWICLDWNTKAISFYQSIGAKPMDDWTIFRLSGKDLSLMAN